MYGKQSTLKILQILLFLLSIAANPKHRVHANLFFYFYIFILFPPNAFTELWAIFTLDSFIYKMDAAVYFITTVIIPSMMVSARRNSDHYVELYHNINHLPKFIDETFFQINAKLMKRKFWRFFLTLLITSTLLAIFPVAVAVFTDAEYGSAPTLFYPSIYPWPVDTAGWYAFTIIAQIVMASIPVLVLVSGILYVRYIEVIVITLHATMRSKIEKMDHMGAQLVHTHTNPKKMISIGETRKIFRSAREPCIDVSERETMNYLRGIFGCHQFLMKYTWNLSKVFIRLIS